MKILFGIQGTGNGHISRARILAIELAKLNVSVDYIFSGRRPENYFDMQAFGNYQTRRGLTFICKDGHIDYLNTILQNNIFSLFREVFSLKLHAYDLIITDFEPVTAWAAKIRNKAVLGIGHQYAFGLNTPLAGDNIFSRALLRNFAPANKSIGLHWCKYNDNVLPPIIDISLRRSNEINHILVYLPFENQSDIINTLQQIPHRKFIIYSPELSTNEQGNVSLRKTCHVAFKDDLIKASGVICNSGFELISECLHLGIPILTKPLNGQMEQHSNALALEQLQYASVTSNLTIAIIENWLLNPLIVEPNPLPNVAKAIAELIADGQWQDYELLGEALWKGTQLTHENND